MVLANLYAEKRRDRRVDPSSEPEPEDGRMRIGGV